MSSIAGKPGVVAMRPAAGQRLGLRRFADVVHDLQSHRAALEVQNTLLREARRDLAEARDRVADLYDFAPVGYLTLDHAGLVTEANLAAASMLVAARSSLIGRGFSRFVTPGHVTHWQRHMRQTLGGEDPAPIELVLLGRGGAPFPGRLDCVPKRTPGGRPALRVTLSDITQHALAEQDRQMAQADRDAREAERRHLAQARGVTHLAVSLHWRAHELVLAARGWSADDAGAAVRARRSRNWTAAPLQHRARTLGARLDIIDTRGADLTIVARMPVPPDRSGAPSAERRSPDGDRRGRPAA